MSLITEVDILDEAKENFLTYSSEVLTDRAIPSIEDGLLSAQRKILWTMEDYLKMNNKSKTKKCNAIVGSTLATSYFHGDASCYGVLCKMSQDYLMRYPLIAGQGSLGTQENNDMVASARYTEAKPSIYADLMMKDFKKNIVPTKETYNGEFMEPVILPSLFPNAICNGRQAIGVSMSHNSSPHNLTEVCETAIAFIQKKISNTNDLLKYLPGPDFPLGGTIINIKDIYTAFNTGHSSVSLKIQGDYEIKDNKIIFTTIPYRTYRNKIKEQIEKNVDVLAEVIEDFDDESNVGQNKLIFYVKKNVNPQIALNRLFKLTDLQTTLSYNMNFIVNGTPKLCSMLDLIKNYVLHQENMLINSTTFDKEKAEARVHILEGLIAAVDKIDEVIKIIKQSENNQMAKEGLMAFLSIDEVQANAVLDMKLGKLSKINKNELIQELEDKKKFIEYCIGILTNKEIRDNTLINIITELKDKYGDKRRTKLLNLEDNNIEAIVPDIVPENCVVSITKSGNIKRIPSKNYKTQKRNGVGIKNNDDIISYICDTNTIDTLMVFSSKGKMYRLLVNNIPEGTNSSKGSNLNTLIKFDKNEFPMAFASLHQGTNAKYVFFVTKNGIIKKVALEEFNNTKRNTGVVAISLKENDALRAVTFIEEETMLLITKNGTVLHFDSKDMPISSRIAQGVKGINLREGDSVFTCLPVTNNKNNLAFISEDGNGKQVLLKEFVLQKRGGRGTYGYRGIIAGCCLINNSNNLLIVGDKSTIKISAKELTLGSKVAQGVKIIKNNNKINSVSKIEE